MSAEHALATQVRVYDHLFAKENPEDTADGADFATNLNPSSLRVLDDCKLEPSLASAAPGSRWQFERQGYFCVDRDSTPGRLVFNRTVGLKDSWAKAQKKQ